MQEIEIDKKYLVYTSSSSKGMIPKYYKDGKWYKLSQFGYESKVEYIISELLKSSNIKGFVEYEECKVNGRNACVSSSFLSEKESFKSFKRLYNIYTGNYLQEDILVYRDVKSRVDYVIDFFFHTFQMDITEYLRNILWLDYITLNDDRHFGNLGMIFNMESGSVRVAPIFDNGGGLLSNYSNYDLFDTIEENIEKVVGAPFSGSLRAQAMLFENPYQFDCSFLEHIEECRGKQVLEYQLKQFGYIK